MTISTRQIRQVLAAEGLVAAFPSFQVTSKPRSPEVNDFYQKAARNLNRMGVVPWTVRFDGDKAEIRFKSRTAEASYDFSAFIGIGEAEPVGGLETVDGHHVAASSGMTRRSSAIFCGVQGRRSSGSPLRFTQTVRKP